MADLPIASAAVLTGAGTASGDLFPMLDVSAAAGLKGSSITRDELRIAMGLTGDGILATGGFTLTVPATGTAALLGTANVFTTLQTITQGTVNTGVLASTGYSLTGSNATSMIDLAGTWNTSGTPTAFKLNITNTTSNAASKLFDLQVGSASKFNVGLNGEVFLNGGAAASFARRTDVNMLMIHDATTGEGVIGIGGSGYSLGINIRSLAQLSWTSDTPAATRDVILGRKAAATLRMGEDAAGVTNQMLTAASRITSDGVGANLTIAGGNGRGGAGGSLIFSYYTTAAAATIGTLTEAMRITTTGAIILAALPTSDPGVSGQLYKSAGVVMQSA